MSFSKLKLYVNSDFPELVALYKNRIEIHNESVLGSKFSNSGFDLHFPSDTTFAPSAVTEFVNFQVKGEMVDDNGNPLAYYIYPRSSISKVLLMLANGTGIIDNSYRGWLIGAFRSLSPKEATCIKKGERLLQVCHPTIQPFLVELVEEKELSSTERGEGGFGSTGK